MLVKVVDAMKKEVSSLEQAQAGKDEDVFSDSELEDQLVELTEKANTLLDKLVETGKSVKQDSLSAVAEMATLFDASGNKTLKRQAAAIDELLFTVAASKSQVAALKAAQDKEVAKLKSQQKDLYSFVKKEHDKQNKVEDAKKSMEDKVKQYQPLEAPLMTRTCPDHPGAQMARIGEGTYQCSLDKGVYNYESGFTTMKGSKIPGTSVLNQSMGHDRPNEFVSFDSRESRLNQK